MFKDHGDEESYGAFCVKFHAFGTPEEVVAEILLAHGIMRKHLDSNRAICSFFEYFCRQPIFGFFFHFLLMILLFYYFLFFLLFIHFFSPLTNRKKPSTLSSDH